jgi:hypothetical protein
MHPQGWLLGANFVGAFYLQLGKNEKGIFVLIDS